MENFTIKRNDSLPAVLATLTTDGTTPVDLTGCTAVFILRKSGSTAAVFRKAAVIVDASAGTVRYDWDETDTAVAGSYSGEFEFARAGGEVFTAPTEGYIPVTILPDLG